MDIRPCDRRAALSAVLCLAVLLAGCSALPGAGPPTTRDPFTAPTVTDDSPGPAPGLAESGVEDAQTLTTIHASTLAGRSYVLEVRTRQRFENGTMRFEQDATGRFGGFGRRYEFVSRFSGRRQPVGNGTEAVVHVWSGGRRILQRTETDGIVQYDGRPIDNEFDRYAVNPSYQNQLYLLFGNLETTLGETREVGNVTLYRVRSTGIEDATGVAGALDVDTVESASLVAWVAETGVVRGYRVRYTGQADGVTVRGVTQVEFTAFGETTVDRPPWYTAAVNATGLE